MLSALDNEDQIPADEPINAQEDKQTPETRRTFSEARTLFRSQSKNSIPGLFSSIQEAKKT
jgi:hypothetical protein